MTTVFSTKRRRAEQLLWTALDQHLLPLMPNGVVLAVSGGPDSRALLEAVATWPGRIGNKVVVACIDHGVRKEAGSEADFIFARATRLGFCADRESIIGLPQANEHDLRHARYRALKKIAQRHGCATMVTAHHRDDDNEGFFLALMGKGGGALGAAMAESDVVDGITLCRPFLSLGKADLLAALTLQGITDYVRDRLDEARAGERAYVRHEIFPELFRKAPQAKHRLQTFGIIERDHAQIVDEAARGLIAWHDSHAEIHIASTSNKSLVSSAIWHVLKRFSDGRDLRKSQKTIARLLESIRISNVPKTFEFAGAFVTTSRTKILIQRRTTSPVSNKIASV